MTAVRTGAGKSQASAYVNKFLREHYLRTTVVRHPMPYGAPLAAMPALWAGSRQTSHMPALLCLVKS